VRERNLAGSLRDGALDDPVGLFFFRVHSAEKACVIPARTSSPTFRRTAGVFQEHDFQVCEINQAESGGRYSCRMAVVSSESGAERQTLPVQNADRSSELQIDGVHA